MLQLMPDTQIAPQDQCAGLRSFDLWAKQVLRGTEVPSLFSKKRVLPAVASAKNTVLVMDFKLFFLFKSSILLVFLFVFNFETFR